MLEKQRAATDIPLQKTEKSGSNMNLTDTPSKLSRSFSALVRRKEPAVESPQKLEQTALVGGSDELVEKKQRPKSSHSAVNTMKASIFGRSTEGLNKDQTVTRQKSTKKSPHLSAELKPSDVQYVTLKGKENVGGSSTALELSATSISQKPAKSMPKITNLFRSKPNLAPPSTTTSAKHRSISASPNTNLGGSIPALNSAPLQATHSKADSASPGAFTAAPLTQAGKAYGLSAYEMHKPAQAKSHKVEDFHIVKRVGKGGFASVYLVRLKTSAGRYWALKVIKKAEVVKLKQEKQILNEKNILKSIQHPFIVELFQTFQDQQYLYMVLEYVDGGDLFSYLRKCQRFTEDEGRFYVAEVLIALEYLHGVDVVYRDLKPEVRILEFMLQNILLDSTGHIKLADFGFAKTIKEKTSSFCGTPDYIANEIVAGKPYNKSVDWWSLGVLIFELVSGKTPFGDESSEKIYDNIQTGNIKWSSLIRGNCREIIAALLRLDYRDRLGSGPGGAKDIKAHPWFEPLNWSKLECRQSTPPYVPVFEAPHILETHKPSGRRDEVLESMKPGAWLNGDPFYEAFKDF